MRSMAVVKSKQMMGDIGVLHLGFRTGTGGRDGGMTFNSIPDYT